MSVLGELFAAGKITPVIDKTFPLDEVPLSLGCLEAGHAQGKIIIGIDASDQSE